VHVIDSTEAFATLQAQFLEWQKKAVADKEAADKAAADREAAAKEVIDSLRDEMNHMRCEMEVLDLNVVQASQERAEARQQMAATRAIEKAAAEQAAAEKEAIEKAAAEKAVAAKDMIDALCAERESMHAEMARVLAELEHLRADKAAAEQAAAAKEAAAKEAAEQAAIEKAAAEQEAAAKARAEKFFNDKAAAAKEAAEKAAAEKAAIEKAAAKKAAAEQEAAAKAAAEKAAAAKEAAEKAAAQKAAIEKAAAEQEAAAKARAEKFFNDKAAAAKEAAEKAAAEKAAIEKAAAEQEAAAKAAAEKAAAEQEAAAQAAAEKAAAAKQAAEKAAAEKETAAETAAAVEAAAKQEAVDGVTTVEVHSGATARSSTEFHRAASSSTEFLGEPTGPELQLHTITSQHGKEKLFQMRVQAGCMPLNFEWRDILARMMDGRGGITFLNQERHPTDDITWAACGWVPSTSSFIWILPAPTYSNAFSIERKPDLVERARVLLPACNMMVANCTYDDWEVLQVCEAFRVLCNMLVAARFPPTVVCANMYVRRRRQVNTKGWPVPVDFGDEDVWGACEDFVIGLKRGLERLGIIEIQMEMAPRPMPTQVQTLLESNWGVVMQHLRDSLCDVLLNRGIGLTDQFPEDAASFLRPHASMTKLFLESPLMSTHPLKVLKAEHDNFDLRSFGLHCRAISKKDEGCKQKKIIKK
jgi:hypothetical protein